MNDLRDDLARFDGKHTDVLERVAASITKSPDTIEQLVVIAEEDPDERAAVAATWVILAWCKNAKLVSLDPSIAVRLCRLLAKAVYWETRLHLLQILGRIDLVEQLSKPQLKSLATSVFATVEDPKPFVRAWSLNLLGLIGGNLDSDLRRRAGSLIVAAERDEPASVKARIRQLRKAKRLSWMP